MGALRRVEILINHKTQRVALVAHTDDQLIELDVCVDDAERVAAELTKAVAEIRKANGN